MLLTPSMQSKDALYADELLSALKSLHSSKKYKRMVIYIEACDSGSMFQKLLPSDMSIYAVTAAAPSEPSYPIYCCNFFKPPSCTVGGQDVGECLGDMFSVAWLEAADQNPKQTLAESFANAKKKTAPGGPQGSGSTVMQFGDLSFLSLPLSTFIGPGSGANVSVTNVELVDGESLEVTREAPKKEISADSNLVLKVNGLLNQLKSQMPRPLSSLASTSDTLPLEKYPCYRRMNALLDQECAPHLLETPHLYSTIYPTYHRAAYALSKQVCLEGSDMELAQAIQSICQ